MRIAVALTAGILAALTSASAQEALPPANPTPVPAAASAAQNPSASAHLTLDDALRLALQHNHALLALRSTILQNQAQEITANLRPNPTLAWDAQFLPISSNAEKNVNAALPPRETPQPLSALKFPIPNASSNSTSLSNSSMFFSPNPL